MRLSTITVNQQKRNSNVKFSLLLFTVLYIIFVIYDMATSAQSGYKNADRTRVHILILCITVYLFLSTFTTLFKQKIENGILLSLFLLLCWTTFVNIMTQNEIWNILVQANMGVQWVLAYIFWKEYQSRENRNRKKVLSFFLGIIWIFLMGMTVYYFTDMISRMDRIPVLNAAYFVIAMIPWIVANGRSNRRWLIYLLGIIIAVLSMKRGAVIAVPVIMLTDYFIQGITSKKFVPFFKVFGLIFLFVIALFIANDLSDGFLFERFSSENLASGSGRAEQIQLVWNELRHQDFLHLMLGEGSHKSIELVGTGIHNEWLQFTYCYGIVGLIIYASLMIGMFSYSFRMLKISPKLAPSCFMMAMFVLILSMISTSYGGYVGFWLFGFWGYIDAKKRYVLENKSYEIVL